FDPEEGFAKVKKYGLPQDEGVKSFISNPTAQLSVRLPMRCWRGERWNFSIETNSEG
ncbi:hypothetical protein Gotur_016058, partial [Gossypium turneri]